MRILRLFPPLILASQLAFAAETYESVDKSTGAEPVIQMGTPDTARARPTGPIVEETLNAEGETVGVSEISRVGEGEAKRGWLGIEGTFSWKSHFSAAVGAGGFYQRSDLHDLSAISPGGPFFEQKLTAGTELTQTRSTDAVAWLAEVQVWTSGFGSFRGTGFRFESLHAWAAHSRGWTFYIGAVFDHSYRWVEITNPAGLNTEGSISLGPAARVLRVEEDSEIGFNLGAPLSGSLTNGQLGVQGRVWGEWRPSWIGLRIEGEGAYLHWGLPEGTHTVTWDAWLGPSIRF